MTTRCLDCHRPLRDPESRIAGRGPGCRTRHSTWRQTHTATTPADGQLTLIDIDSPEGPAMHLDSSGVAHAAARILNAAGVPAARFTNPDDGTPHASGTGYSAAAFASRVVTIHVHPAPDSPTDPDRLLTEALTALTRAGWTIKHQRYRMLRAVAPAGAELPEPPEQYPYIVDDAHAHNTWVVRDENGDVGHIESREIPRDLPRGIEAHWDGHRKIMWSYTYTLTNPDEEADLTNDDIISDDREYDSLNDACKAALDYYPTYQKAQEEKYGRP